jgi:hypothetical protein
LALLAKSSNSQPPIFAAADWKSVEGIDEELISGGRAAASSRKQAGRAGRGGSAVCPNLRRFQPSFTDPERSSGLVSMAFSDVEQRNAKTIGAVKRELGN